MKSSPSSERFLTLLTEFRESKSLAGNLPQVESPALQVTYSKEDTDSLGRLLLEESL